MQRISWSAALRGRDDKHKLRELQFTNVRKETPPACSAVFVVYISTPIQNQLPSSLKASRKRMVI